jgi:hypothetical protein
MVKGKTSTGFSFVISDSAINNMELLDALGSLESNPLYMGRVLSLLLGERQKKKLYDHVRAKDGTVPQDKIGDEIMEIFKTKPVKN